ncbi:MAG: SNF2-related protein [Cyclobacteriaceae bacterium]
MKSKKHISQLKLDYENPDSSQWPSHENFPLNINKGIDRNVKSILESDIDESKDYIIITGFTSLSTLIDYFSKLVVENKKIKVALGWKPLAKGRKTYPIAEMKNEVKNFWLKERYSIILSGAIGVLIKKIEDEEITFKFLNKLHAKLYVGDTHAILGSSNFSRMGLVMQHEANIRVNKYTESDQYIGIRDIAEKFYNISAEYNNEIIDLLKGISREVTWQEAIARAIVEVLDSEWAIDYNRVFGNLNIKLWPTQKQGIVQAMSILRSKYNVLIADATGSGKTKTISTLIQILIHNMWENGKTDIKNTLIITPPQVTTNWNEEFSDLGLMGSNSPSISMGLYSRKGKRSEQAKKDLNNTHILVLDEAHNFLNPNSQRSKAIQKSNAAYNILSTATPISRKLSDILRIIELLDVDNLSDEDFKMYKHLKSNPLKQASNENLLKLRKFISGFIVRRTKSTINKIINQNKALYKNEKLPQYPQNIPIAYETGETENDIEIANKITDLATQLEGLIHLRNFTYSKENSREEIKNDLIKRQNAARGLAIYKIRKAMRSSKAALIEHLMGTEKAELLLNFKSSKSKNKTGNHIHKIEKYKNHLPRFILPKKHKDEEFGQPWLFSAKLYNEKCNKEISIYRDIFILAKKLSFKREEKKASLLYGLLKKHDLILAFDSTIITLDYLGGILKRDIAINKLHIVAGDENDSSKERVKEYYKIGSNKKGHIALCTDKMSEGVNLQQSSAVVLLDMPSVLKTAEQRIGRIDRLNSPYTSIETYWPEDSDAFGLNGDLKLRELSYSTSLLYGGNLELPPENHEKKFEGKTAIERAQELKSFQDSDEEWEGFKNYFEHISDLKDGNHALISNDIYLEIKGTKSDILTRYSFIKSKKDWCFLAIEGDKHQSPRWVIVQKGQRTITDFIEICDFLKECISGNAIQLPLDKSLLKSYIIEIRKQEREMLPVKKKRALEVAEKILKKKKNKGDLKEEAVDQILNLYNPKEDSSEENYSINLEKVSEWWVEKLMPYLDNLRNNSKSYRNIYNLNSLYTKSIDISISEEELLLFNNEIFYNRSIDSRIVSYIISSKEES